MKKQYIIVFFVLALFISLLNLNDEDTEPSFKKNERYYQEILCNDLQVKVEVVLEDKSRVDCLTDEFAIEVDWANKWSQGVGQAMYYALMTGKKPAIGLIMSQSKSDKRHYERLMLVTEELNIHLIRIDK
jgi:hypothetical protein